MSLKCRLRMQLALADVGRLFAGLQFMDYRRQPAYRFCHKRDGAETKHDEWN